MTSEVFTVEELESLPYRVLIQIAKKHYMYQKKRSKKSQLVKKMVGLRKNQEEVHEDFNTDIENLTASNSEVAADRRLTFIVDEERKTEPIRNLTIISSPTVNKTPSVQQLPVEQSKSEIKRARKMPNFKAIHAKHFARMESLVENVEKNTKRANHLLSTPTLKKSGIPVYVAPVKKELKESNSSISRREGFNKAITTKAPPVSMDRTKDKTRSIISGIRSNRRFELQLKLRQAKMQTAN